MQILVSQIRQEKMSGVRQRPSIALIDRSKFLRPSQRRCLLDKVAGLVDENLFGRAEMCVQFADLLQRALAYLGLPSRSVAGQAVYYANEKEIFRWDHSWVRIADEVVDSNVDSLFENPVVPSEVKVAPYWGPIAETPTDRKLRENHGKRIPTDKDVSEIWWPELHAWLKEQFEYVEQKGAANPP